MMVLFHAIGLNRAEVMSCVVAYINQPQPPYTPLFICEGR